MNAPQMFMFSVLIALRRGRQSYDFSNLCDTHRESERASGYSGSAAVTCSLALSVFMRISKMLNKHFPSKTHTLQS